MLIAHLTEALQELLRRRDVSTLSEHGFDDDRGCIARRRLLFQQEVQLGEAERRELLAWRRGRQA